MLIHHLLLGLSDKHDKQQVAVNAALTTVELLYNTLSLKNIVLRC